MQISQNILNQTIQIIPNNQDQTTKPNQANYPYNPYEPNHTIQMKAFSHFSGHGNFGH